MNFELLWSMDEYQALLDYKWNSFHFINMFLSEDITNRERKFNGKEKNYPQTPEEFKKSIETTIQLYKAIKKNYVLNGSKEYSQPLFRGMRKNSKHSYFTSTTESIETALSFINGINSGNTSNDVLIEIDSSQTAWIDLESFIPESKGGSMDEKEILFVPSVYQIQKEMNFNEYLNASEMPNSLSGKTKRKLDRLKDLTCRKVKLIASSYKTSTYVPLNVIATKYEQYRQNLIQLAEATKTGNDITEISRQITEFKRLCSDYIYSQFNEIDNKLEQAIHQNLSDEQIHIDRNSVMQEVHVGNTGRMFSIQYPEGVEKYYFKPAESKDRVAKPYRAYIQEAAYNVQRIINPTRTVKCNTCNINGMFGAIQEKVEIDKDATRQFHRYFYDNSGELDLKLLSQILDEYLVDYCLCNYDAHARNFVIDSSGNLRGIDKEQSFRYIDKDSDGDMVFSKNYNEEYGESATIYTTIFKKIASGEISYNVLEGLNYRAARLTQIPDEEYRKIFKNYAYSKTKTPQEAEILLEQIVKRKQSIIKKIDILKQDLYNQSYYNTTGNLRNEEYVFTDNVVSIQNMAQQQKPSEIHKQYIKPDVVMTITDRDSQLQNQLPLIWQSKDQTHKPIGSESTNGTEKLNQKKQQLHEMQEQLRLLQEKQKMSNQESLITEEKETHGMSM